MQQLQIDISYEYDIHCTIEDVCCGNLYKEEII